MARPPTAGQPIFPQQPGPTAVRSSAGPEGSPVSDLKISDPVFTLTLARGVEKGGLSVSNSSSGRRWKLDHAPAVGDPTHMVEFGTGRRAFAREA